MEETVSVDGFHAVSARRGDGGGGVSPLAAKAWANSTLAMRLSGDPADMLVGACVLQIPAGDSIYRLEGSEPLLAVVVEGLARVYTMSPEGRQATIRYVTESDVLGLPVALTPSVFADGGLTLAVQALTPCCLLRLSLPRFRAVAERDPRNMWGLLVELAHSLVEGSHMLADNVFLPVRCRVASHMLDLATREDSVLVVHASQQDIADAIGSVREVVSRAILRLRDEGLIHRAGAVYVIDDPARLHAATKRQT